MLLNSPSSVATADIRSGEASLAAKCAMSTAPSTILVVVDMAEPFKKRTITQKNIDELPPRIDFNIPA